MDDMTQLDSLAARYRALESDRQPYLDRARDGAKVTIPSLMPPHGASGSTRLRSGHQSFGARGVNNLTSKTVLTLMPPNRPFHRTDIDELSLAKLADAPGVKADIQDSLAKYDRVLNTHIEASQLRSKANEAFRQLFVAGTVLLHILDESRVRMHKLDSFVQQLDATGKLLEAIIREKVSPDTLSAKVKEACQVGAKLVTGKVRREDVEVYTTFRLENGKYKVWQEINGILVPGSNGSYPEDTSPLISMRMIAIDGENYGRSYVEEYMGDLVSMESHTKVINEGAILSNRYIFFLAHGANTTPKQLQSAKNGDVLRGNAADISTMHVDKANDMQIGLSIIDRIEQRLSYAFLMHTAIQRNGERVTAEEIRIMARELEEGLGGLYSLMSQEFQLPVIRAYRAMLEKKGKLPELQKDIVSVKIVTGLEALGRGQDTDQLQMFVGDALQLGQPALELIDIREVLIRMAVSRGIDTSDLVKTREQLQQEKQQQMMQQITQQAAPGIVQQAAQGMMDGAAAPQQP